MRNKLLLLYFIIIIVVSVFALVVDICVIMQQPYFSPLLCGSVWCVSVFCLCSKARIENETAPSWRWDECMGMGMCLQLYLEHSHFK